MTPLDRFAAAAAHPSPPIAHPAATLNRPLPLPPSIAPSRSPQLSPPAATLNRFRVALEPELSRPEASDHHSPGKQQRQHKRKAEHALGDGASDGPARSAVRSAVRSDQRGSATGTAAAAVATAANAAVVQHHLPEPGRPEAAAGVMGMPPGPLPLPAAVAGDGGGAGAGTVALAAPAANQGQGVGVGTAAAAVAAAATPAGALPAPAHHPATPGTERKDLNQQVGAGGCLEGGCCSRALKRLLWVGGWVGGMVLSGCEGPLTL